MSFPFALGLAYLIPCDGEGETPEGETPEGEGEPTPKTFTQEDVNKIVGQRQKALKTQFETLEKNYKGLLEQTNLSESQRQQLEADLQNVQSQLRTKEQQAALDAQAAKTKYENELKKAQEERTRYQQLFETSTIERAIIDAAAQHEAYAPSQFVTLLGNKIKVVEELDDQGNKTGRYVPLAEVDQKDPETGQVAKVRKTPAELIASLKEDIANYGNLFKSNVAKGVGEGRDAGAGGRVDPSKVSDEEYFANRQTYQRALGIRGPRGF